MSTNLRYRVCFHVRPTEPLTLEFEDLDKAMGAYEDGQKFFEAYAPGGRFCASLEDAQTKQVVFANAMHQHYILGMRSQPDFMAEIWTRLGRR